MKVGVAVLLAVLSGGVSVAVEPTKDSKPLPIVGTRSARPEWSATLNPMTPGTVRVVIDMTKFSIVTFASKVNVQLEVFDRSNRKIGSRKFVVMDHTGVLIGGQQYGRDFEHGFSDAAAVLAKDLKCMIGRSAQANKP